MDLVSARPPLPFVNECSQFIYTESLQQQGEEKSEGAEPVKKRSRNELRGDTALVRLLRTAVEKTSDDDGWASLSRVGDYISNNSSFSPINYGYKKLSELIKASELFDFRHDDEVVYIKDPRGRVEGEHLFKRNAPGTGFVDPPTSNPMRR